MSEHAKCGTKHEATRRSARARRMDVVHQLSFRNLTQRCLTGCRHYYPNGNATVLNEHDISLTWRPEAEEAPPSSELLDFRLEFTMKSIWTRLCCRTLAYPKTQADGHFHCMSATERADSLLRNSCGMLHVLDRVSLAISFSGQLVMSLYDAPSGRDLATVASSVQVNDAAWHQVTVTSTGQTARLSVDGAHMGTLVAPAPATGTGRGRAPRRHPEWLRLGRLAGRAQIIRSYRGQLRDFRLQFRSDSIAAPLERFLGPPPPGAAEQAQWKAEGAAADTAWLLQQPLRPSDERVVAIRRELEVVASRPSDCVPARAIAITLINEYMAGLHAIQVVLPAARAACLPRRPLPIARSPSPAHPGPHHACPRNRRARCPAASSTVTPC